MAKKFNRDTEGAPLSRGLSAAEIITKAAGKKSYDQVTEDDIRSLGAAQGFGKNNIEKMVKGFRNLGAKSLEINESGDQFNVFNPDGSGADRTTRKTGNRRGFDPADLLGTGRNINKFAALASNANKEQQKKDISKSEEKPKVETVTLSGDGTGGYQVGGDNTPSVSGEDKGKGEGPTVTETKTEWGKSNVPDILKPNEERKIPAIGDIDGGFHIEGLNKKPKSSSEKGAQSSWQDNVGLDVHSIGDFILGDANPSQAISEILNGQVPTTLKNLGTVWNPAQIWSEGARQKARNLAKSMGPAPETVGGSVPNMGIFTPGPKQLPAANWNNWKGKVNIPPDQIRKQILEISKSKLPDNVKQIRIKELTNQLEKGFKFSKSKAPSTGGSKVTQSQTTSSQKTTTPKTNNPVNPNIKPFSPDVPPNFQQGVNPTSGLNMKSTTFDRMSEYTDEATDAFSNWLKQMKKGGKLQSGGAIEKRRIGGSARLFAQGGLKLMTPPSLKTPVYRGLGSDVKDRFGINDMVANMTAFAQIGDREETPRIAGTNVAIPKIVQDTKSTAKSQPGFNSDIDNRKKDGFGITKDNVLDAAETAWSIGYPELMKRKLRMEKESPRNRKYIEFGAMPEQDLPFKPEVKSATPNQRNMVVDAQAMLGFAKAVNSENEQARRQWGYQNAAQKLATRANIIETKNKERVYNDQQQTQDANQLAYRNLQREMYNQQTMKEIGQGTYANVLKGIREPRFNRSADMYENAREIIRSEASSPEMRKRAEEILAGSFKMKKGGKVTASSLMKTKC